MNKCPMVLRMDNHPIKINLRAFKKRQSEILEQIIQEMENLRGYNRGEVPHRESILSDLTYSFGTKMVSALYQEIIAYHDTMILDEHLEYMEFRNERWGT